MNRKEYILSLNKKSNKLYDDIEALKQKQREHELAISDLEDEIKEKENEIEEINAELDELEGNTWESTEYSYANYMNDVL